MSWRAVSKALGKPSALLLLFVGFKQFAQTIMFPTKRIFAHGFHAIHQVPEGILKGPRSEPRAGERILDSFL